ncbi:NAD-dependent epimerase [Cohnella suwonensis]|uniref:NAD-dependent epimerase n=1 Tax=Cohnella suwonensis TaxID=696072 RepID=A0ABW0M2E6_9BACL
MTILVTGAAGFIGFHTSRRLLREGLDVIGLDNMNDYYDVNLKKDRLELLNSQPSFRFIPVDIANQGQLNEIFANNHVQAVIHLAAQAGVRYSLENPHAYIESNITGFLNILEACRLHHIDHLIYASSSSVYGANTRTPFSVHDPVDHPVSLYAATKKSNELMAHTYSHLYGLPTTGLRFFTVYGPWGRPDMAYYSFAKKIIEGLPIQVFNYGDMKRDFTYIEDIVEGIVRLINLPPKANEAWNRTHSDPSSSYAPYKIYNIGNNEPVELKKFIHILEQLIGKQAVIEYMPMQPGDVLTTYADIEELTRDVGFSPSTSIEEGLGHFVNWFRSYYTGLI